jgi:hypothetical protein
VVRPDEGLIYLNTKDWRMLLGWKLFGMRKFHGQPYSCGVLPSVSHRPRFDLVTICERNIARAFLTRFCSGINIHSLR